MKKIYGAFFTKFNLLFLVLCFAGAIKTQAQIDISIGTGTTGNTSTSYPCPLQDFWEGSRAQYLYKASELTAAGMNAGNILAIKFNVTALNATGVIEQYTVKIGTSTTASLGTTTWEPGTTTVYGPFDYQPVTGINTFTFTSPFLWNGTDNIIIEICNGDPNNASGIFYTNNATVPWTTGLSFNGSRTYAADNAGNLCGTTAATSGSVTNTATARPNITFSWAPAAACSGTPTGGTTNASISNVCNPTTPFTLSVTGSTSASGLLYQWQSSPNNTTWTNISGATSSGYTITGISANTYYRRQICCGAECAFSSSVLVTTNAPAYTTLPFTESFENTWSNVCDVDDVPNNFWRNSPATGNNSWRRNDDGASAIWTAPANGAYTPTSSAGTFSARFHTYNASSGTKGDLDLYVNCNTPAVTKSLSFDFINTSGSDSLVIYFSTNGGASFTRLDSAHLAAAWTTRTLYFNSQSATTVIRFEATSDFGVTDIGLDNINLVDFPNCTGTPTAGSTASTVTSVCNPATPFTVSVNGATNAGALTYQWQSSTDGGLTWNNISGATNLTYTSTGVGVTTSFRRQITCSGNSSFSTPVSVSVSAPTYTTLPFTESFENQWINVCSTDDAPNNSWRNNPATGNNSWRRDDDAASAAWVNPTLGAYTPTASAGSHSARFHTYQATSGTKGQLDLYVNCNTPATTKALSFDFINTSGSDSLVIYFSTNGGTSFTRLDSAHLAASWTTRTIYFNSQSATSVIRFEATSDFGVTDIGLDNINLVDFPNCTGTPVAGSTVSTITSVCNPATPFTVSVNGATNAGALTYQWQLSTDGGVTWNNIAIATNLTYTSTGIAVTTSFRRQITCSGNSSFSTPVTVSVSAPTYTTLPFTESFENPWINVCDVDDAPNNSWRNNPATGNNSWRRDDDGATAVWTAAATGIYNPVASAGAHSARFHSYFATGGSKGQLDLYVNCNTSVATKLLSFDFINVSGTDSLTVLISTNGGTSFTRLDSARLSSVWRNKTIQFTSSSATTVIRFEATSDFGNDDIGLDNVSIANFPPCSGTPTGGTTVASPVSVCNATTPINLSVSGASVAAGLTYQWQSSTDNVTFTNISGATSATYTSAGISVNTYFRRQIICAASSSNSFSTSVLVSTATSNYATLPYTQSFENTWTDGCNTRDIPDIYWKNTPNTGDNSWRRDDDAAAANWVNPTLGAYTPPASDGLHSARFHSYQAANGTKGQFDLYIKCNTAAANKRLSFDYINTSGSDSLVVYLSTNGGTTFTRLDSVHNATAWATRLIFFNSTSATTIIRFEATSDFGVTDIGLDNIFVADWPDCNGTPNGGTAITSSGSVCTEAFTLSATGLTTGNGVGYQWQKSINGGTTWTNIPGANNISYTTTQVGTTLYRVVVFCSLSGQSANSTSVQVVSPLPARGIYTINGATATNIPARTFQTFNDAYTYIKCGIDSAVIFNVQPGSGPYNEQLIMNTVPGTSPANTVTFKGNGAALGFASSNSNERATIKLKGTRYIIFDSLVINATAGTYGYGVQLINNADSNTIKNCTINSTTNSTTQNFAGVVINGTDAGPVSTGNVLCDYNVFQNNKINGGYYGITLVASFVGGASGNNKFINNDIKDFYSYGMYVSGSYNTLIEGNKFSRPTRTPVGDFNGIYFVTEKNTGCSVSKNRIFNPFGGDLTNTGNFYGIYFNNSDASVGAENTVSNNLIYNVNGNGPDYGIANVSSDYVYYFHNTISLDNATSTSTSTTRGFYQTTVAGGLFFYDNIITITRGGTGAKHCIYLGSNLLTGADNNDYYINAAAGTNFVGFYTSNRNTLVDWRAATNLDANSLSTNPAYTDPANGNFAPGNAGIDNKGIYVGIDTDINNAPRNPTTPDIGAYEFTPAPCAIPPVNGTTSLSASVICQNTAVFLTLNIGAYGSGQRFQWQTSTSATGPFTNLGSPLLTPDTTIFSTTTLYYRAIVSCVSSRDSSNPVLLTVTPALPIGTYTINKNNPTTYVPGVTGGNFNSFADAKASMSCGILGAVVFNVVSNTGPYNEQLKLDSIKGTSPVNTITFNGNGNTITFNSANSNERAVIKLNGSHFIIFDSLRIDAGTGTYGYNVQLINNADSNIFRKCTLVNSITTTSTNFAGVVINATDAGLTSSGNTLCDGNTFDKNTITGGYYGITAVGNTTSVGYINNNKFTNNTIRDFYNAGIYIAGTYNTLIEGNTFSRPSSTVAISTVYGIFVTAVQSNALKISKNRFTNFFGAIPTTTGTFYGVYHNSVDATAGSETVVSNNLFYNLNGNGSIYPLYNVSADNVQYYHNTISMDNTLSTSTLASAAFYQTTLATGIQFKDNLITITKGGTGTKHAIYLNTTTSDVTSNYNDLYVNANNAFVGYNGANRATLADWFNSSRKDSNSLSVNPLYTDSTNGNFKPQLASLDNKGTPVGITTDILNAVRSNTTPDIGAYEFVPNPCQNPPIAGVASVTPSSGICLEAPIQLNITGNSPLGSLTFQWQNSPDGINWTNIGPLQYFPQFNTVTSTSTYYRAAVSCGATTVYTNTVQVTLNSILLAGTYSIDPSQPASTTNFQSFQSAVNALLCGITGKVVFNAEPGTYNEQIRIPYIPGTSNTKTVTFQSRTGIVSSVNLSFNSTSAAQNYTLRLDSTKNFIFKNLTITATNATNGRAVELANVASADTILSCKIVSPVTTSTANTIVGVYANPVKGTDLVIKGNTITNGANGIYFSGTSATALTNPNLVIDSNQVLGSYNHGIFVQYANKIKVTNNSVSLSGAPIANTAGIYFNNNDSSYKLTGNTVNINGVTSTAVYGIYVSTTHALLSDSAIVAGNKIVADNGNTGTIYGLTLTSSRGISAVNNVVAINSAGATAYGLYNLNNTDEINYYNNTVNLQTNSANGYAGYFTQTVAARFNVYNNIFSNKGGGRALFVNNPSYYSADYNMLYSSGTNLVQTSTGAVTDFTNVVSWKNTWNWDKYAIGYSPAFISTTDLRPDGNNPDAWAIQGRGTQIRGNNYDFNNNYRPDFLTAGVPDLGAYEFFPVALPTVLTAIPATPAPNTTQIFYYGTDTVTKITWGATAPPSIQVRRFSGVVPSGLVPGTDSMFFYVKADIPGGSNYPYSMKLYYISPWLGSIPQENRLGLGRTTPSNAWVVGANSRVDISKKEIRQDALIFLDRFTGLTNPFSTPEVEDSSSNRGKDFWVGYQRSYDMTPTGGAMDMVVYMGAGDVPAHVTITIEGTNGTPWVRNYTVPANSALTSETIPKTGTDDARLYNEGFYPKKGIHITSDVPIVAYAHIYYSANSGATMLMPTAVWGYENYILTSRQYYSTTNAYSAFHVIAQHDSTWVEINPSKPTLNGWVPNGGTQPNGSYLVKLNKGDVYQVLGAILTGSEGQDLTGSYVKSIGNGQGTCYPIAVFSGSTRTGIGCGTSPGSSGDLIIQQNFPYQAWGNKYATTPTSNSNGPNATSNMTSIFRIMVKDPTTQVKLNGTVLTGLIANRYYQYESNAGDYIESNKPVMVAQYMASNGLCSNTGIDGDPEMFYISPLQQAVKKTQFYRNSLYAITENFITLVIPTEGLATLKIDGISYLAYPATLVYVANDPNLPGYKIVTKRWAAGNGSSTVESDLPFTGIVYGEGSVESYGYNLGTLVKNLNNLGSVNTVLNAGTNPTEYTCKGAQFKLRALLPLRPDSIQWQLSLVPHISPNTNVTQVNPTVVDSTTVNGLLYYIYELNINLTIDSAGIFAVPIQYWSQDIESCDKKHTGIVYVQVIPAPITDFQISYSSGNPQGCTGDQVTFTGDIVTQNGIALNQWQWTFHTGATASGQVTTFTYPTAGTFPVKLKGITADGCISDTTKPVVINARPVVTVAQDSIPVCPGSSATFTITNPITGATYTWYSTPTGGTPVATGTSFTVNNITGPLTYYVEGTASGCPSAIRKKVTISIYPALTQAVVTQTGSTANTVTFSWTAVPGAASYQVSTDGGVTFVTPSSGATGLTHVATTTGTLQQACIVVKALGTISCQSSISPSVCGCTNSSTTVTPDSIAVCPGGSATFNVTNPVTGITYKWFSTATGGAAISTGSSFTVTNVTATSVYYVEQASATCTGTVRTKVTVAVLQPLAVPVVTVVQTATTVNSLTFSWNPVPGAASYQVSIDNGVTFVTPSSGPTGLTHTVTGLVPLQQVTLIVKATGLITCQTSTSLGVTGRTFPDQIFIPNSFTPNGDGLNDVLLVYGYVIQSMQFAVFNQWGEKVFESTNQSIGWDGRSKGKPQPSGVYMYVGKFILKDGTTITRKGSINLVR